MLWYIVHNLVHLLPFGSDQTKNLFTFLFGVVSYTLMYSWFGSINKEDNVFIFSLFNYFSYSILADAFAMAIIYKNYYKSSIIGEATEVFSNKPNNFDEYVGECNKKLSKELHNFMTKDNNDNKQT